MWFATNDGLNKYDGYKFTVYKHDASVASSINSNSINDLLQDDKNNLWVVTMEGLEKYDRFDDVFKHYKCDDDKLIFRNIFQDSKKRIWLGSTGGLCLFNPEKGSFKIFKHNDRDQNSLSNDYINRVTEDNEGALWIATRNGLNRLDTGKQLFTHYNNEPGNNKSIGSGYVKSVYKDNKGNIWIGTQGSGVALYDREHNSFINFRHDPLNSNSISHNDILSFAEDANGRLWVGTENGGIAVYNRAAKNFFSYQYSDTDPASLSNNSVYCLYKDDIANMWAGTWAGGINFLPFFGDKFRHYSKVPYNSNSLSNNIVLSITGDSAGYIWIGTDGGGLNRFDIRTNKFTSFTNKAQGTKGIFTNYVLSVAEYEKGVLALGFHRGGLDLFHIAQNQFTHYVPKDSNINRLTSLTINVTYKDSKGNLWVGASDNGGLFLFNKETSGFTRYASNPGDSKSFGSSVVHSIYETKCGELWIGGDRGLDLFNRDTKEFTHYQYDPNNKSGISSNYIYSIMEDKAGNLWLGTSNGLNYFNRKANSFINITEKDGLPSNLICGTLMDHHGNLWISSNKGLSCYNPVTRTFRNYDVNDGLQSNTFKPKSCFQSNAGEMLFGGVNGFNSFFPDSIKENSYVPPVYLTGFLVFNKPVCPGGGSSLTQSINEVKEIRLPYSHSVFTFEFAALNFTQPGQNKYSYKLQGFDHEWSAPDLRRSATYTNLNPGTYIFEVKGSNNDGVWNKKATSVKIIILPPFWLTRWFIAGVILLAIGSIAGLYRYRLSSIKKQKLVLEKKVSEQTIELVHLNKEEHIARLQAEQARGESEKARQEAMRSNKELELKNIELEQFAYVASHDLQEPLRTTLGFVGLLEKRYRGKLDSTADKYLTYISEASGRMQILIRDLLDFSRIGKKGEMEKIDCNNLMQYLLEDIAAAVNEAKAKIHYDTLPVITGYATEINLLFQNLLINSLKFSKKDIAPDVFISVEKINDYWQFEVKDNGIGIEEQYSERIFDIFQRLHTRTEYEGSGIGLSHCKKIVELHQGSIWVQSVPGQGSTFYFTIYDGYELHQQAHTASTIS